MPQDWIDGILVSLYKSQGEKSVCDHYHGITQLIEKMLEKVHQTLYVLPSWSDYCG